jgi:hypothetical protein
MEACATIRFNADESVFVDPIICAASTREALQKQSDDFFYTGVDPKRKKTFLRVQKKRHDQLKNGGAGQDEGRFAANILDVVREGKSFESIWRKFSMKVGFTKRSPGGS